MTPNQSRGSLSSDKDAEPVSTTSTASDSRIRDLITLTPNGLSNVLKKSRTRLQAPSSSAVVGKEKKSLELNTFTSIEHDEPRHPGPPVRRPKNILDLHPELQLMIIEHLHFGDIVRLRQTCKRYRALTSPTQMRALFGPLHLRHEILGHCKVCLERDLDGETQLLSTPTDLGYPFSSICIKCALIANDRRLRVGQQVQLGNHASAWICRWCGWPIHEGVNSCSKPHFHHSCEWAFRAAMRRFVLLGWIQLALGIVAAALSWRYFRHAALVFAPTVTSFLLLWLCLAYLISQPLQRFSYFIVLFLELAILGCWIPPTYYISIVIAARPPGTALPKVTVASLTFFCLNMFFRLVNVLGYIAIISGYDLARRKRPQVSTGRKLTYPVMFWLIQWAYPPSVGHSGALIDEEAPFTFRRV